MSRQLNAKLYQTFFAVKKRKISEKRCRLFLYPLYHNSRVQLCFLHGKCHLIWQLCSQWLANSPSLSGLQCYGCNVNICQGPVSCPMNYICKEERFELSKQEFDSFLPWSQAIVYRLSTKDFHTTSEEGV